MGGGGEAGGSGGAHGGEQAEEEGSSLHVWSVLAWALLCCVVLCCGWWGGGVWCVSLLPVFPGVVGTGWGVACLDRTGDNSQNAPVQMHVGLAKTSVASLACKVIDAGRRGGGLRLHFLPLR